MRRSQRTIEGEGTRSIVERAVGHSSRDFSRAAQLPVRVSATMQRENCRSRARRPWSPTCLALILFSIFLILSSSLVVSAKTFLLDLPASKYSFAPFSSPTTRSNPSKSKLKNSSFKHLKYSHPIALFSIYNGQLFAKSIHISIYRFL